MVSAARTAITTCRSPWAGTRASTKSRTISAKAAAFDPTARYAVMGTGAPS